MSSDNVEKLSAIIPEAWFDLIDRVVPGTVIVLASFPTDLDSKLSGLSLGGFAAGLVVAYVVGFVFEVVSDLLVGWWVPTIVGAILAALGFMGCYSNRKLWEKIDKQPSPRREIAGKMLAEGAMFKSLGFYELLQIFLAIPTPTCWYSGLIPRAALSKIWVHPWQLSLGFAVVAFVGWVRMQCIVTGRLKSWECTPGFLTYD